jgi:hypothetical protein
MLDSIVNSNFSSTDIGYNLSYMPGIAAGSAEYEYIDYNSTVTPRLNTYVGQAPDLLNYFKPNIYSYRNWMIGLGQLPKVYNAIKFTINGEPYKAMSEGIPALTNIAYITSGLMICDYMDINANFESTIAIGYMANVLIRYGAASLHQFLNNKDLDLDLNQDNNLENNLDSDLDNDLEFFDAIDQIIPPVIYSERLTNSSVITAESSHSSAPICRMSSCY